MQENLIFNIFNLCLIPFIIWGYVYLWRATRTPKEPK